MTPLPWVLWAFFIACSQVRRLDCREGIGLVQNRPNLEDFTLLFWRDGTPFIPLDPKHVGLGMLCKIIEDFTQGFANTGHKVTRLTLKRTDIWEEAIQGEIPTLQQ